MVRIRFRDGSYLDYRDGKWGPSGYGAEQMIRVADSLSQLLGMHYSPADGDYGVYLAERIADKLRGKIEVDESEREEEVKEVIY